MHRIPLCIGGIPGVEAPGLGTCVWGISGTGVMGPPGPTLSGTSGVPPCFPWSFCRVLRRGSGSLSPCPPGVAHPHFGPISPFWGLSRLGPAPAGIPWPTGVGRGW